MDELTTLIKELEHQPPPSLARQRLRLDAAARKERAGRPAGPGARGRAFVPRALAGWRLAAIGTVAAAAVAGATVPALIGSAQPAYALTERPDGSINLKINDFRDPDEVERDLAAMGVTADITYLPLGKQCQDARAPFLAGDDVKVPKEELTSSDPAVQAKARERLRNTPSALAIRPVDGITIHPGHIGAGQIVMLEVMENPDTPSRDDPGVAWEFRGRLTDGPVQPCQVVDDPTAHEIGDATPPPGN